MTTAPAQAEAAEAAVPAEANAAGVPSIAAEIGLDSADDSAQTAAVTDDVTVPVATDDADRADGTNAGAVDFSAVLASTTSPAQPVATTASVAPPARPLVIGAHAPQGPGLGGAFLALVLVLGLIVGLAWLLKRLPGGGFRQADGLRIVASIPLGAKERAAVIQVGGEQLLVGIGAGGVRTLHVLPVPLPDAAPAQMPTLKNLPDFKQLLAQRLRKDT